jgi:hypothetical protein
MKNVIVNFINANQGAHIVRSKNFLLNLKKLDLQNKYLILSEKKIDIFSKNFSYVIFNISQNKFIAIIQRFIIQNFIINIIVLNTTFQFILTSHIQYQFSF